MRRKSKGARMRLNKGWFPELLYSIQKCQNPGLYYCRFVSGKVNSWQIVVNNLLTLSLYWVSGWPVLTCVQVSGRLLLPVWGTSRESAAPTSGGEGACCCGGSGTRGQPTGSGSYHHLQQVTITPTHAVSLVFNTYYIKYYKNLRLTLTKILLH